MGYCVIANTKNIDAYLDNNSDAGFAIHLIGVGTYMGYLESFASNIDNNLQQMEDEGVAITIHNVFYRLLDKIQKPIMKITKVLEILVIVLSFIFLLVILIVYFILKKNDGELSDSRILIVDQGERIERAADRHNRGE